MDSHPDPAYAVTAAVGDAASGGTSAQQGIDAIAGHGISALVCFEQTDIRVGVDVNLEP